MRSGLSEATRRALVQDLGLLPGGGVHLPSLENGGTRRQSLDRSDHIGPGGQEFAEKILAYESVSSGDEYAHGLPSMDAGLRRAGAPAFLRRR